MARVTFKHLNVEWRYDGQIFEFKYLGEDWFVAHNGTVPQEVRHDFEQRSDPFGDAVKAAQDQPEPSTGYTPERFSDNKDFDADKAWRETMGSNW